MVTGVTTIEANMLCNAGTSVRHCLLFLRLSIKYGGGGGGGGEWKYLFT